MKYFSVTLALLTEPRLTELLATYGSTQRGVPNRFVLDSFRHAPQNLPRKETYFIQLECTELPEALKFLSVKLLMLTIITLFLPFAGKMIFKTSLAF